MNRSQLRNMIDSGRAVAMDCYAIGESIPADDAIGKLFQTDIMNKSVIMKRFEPALSTARQPVIVSTVVYFPYDTNDVYAGGESLNYNDGGSVGVLSQKISRGEISSEMQERIDADLKTLDLIDSMHSLDPFLFKTKVEQIDGDARFNDAYFAISAEEWEKIREPIRQKISKLVVKALGEVDSATDNLARDEYVERFLMKIWEAKDVQGIEPFIKAMQIEPEQAPNVFFAWKAVCYYQVRFTEILEALKSLFQWVGNDELCFPANFASLQEPELDQIRERREELRQKMREGYFSARKVISEYEESYDQFVDKDRPKTFMNFLENAEISYLLLANHVSIATHSVNMWTWYVEQYGPELQHAQFKELFEGLTMLHGVEMTSKKKNLAASRMIG